MSMHTSERHDDLFVYRELSDEELEQFQQRGHHAYGRILTDSGLERMREECMNAWVAEKGPYDPGGTWLKNSLLHNIHHHSKIVRDYYFEGPLVNIATQVISPNIKAATSQLTFKMRGNTMDFAWHQDNGYGELDPYNAISCLTALDDTDESNGCLWLIPGSHLEGQIATTEEHTLQAKDAQSEIRLEADDHEAVPVPMKAGESLFFNCWMLHKSEGNKSTTRDRRMVFVRYADADAVEVYNERQPRLGRLVRGRTRYPEVANYEADL